MTFSMVAVAIVRLPVPMRVLDGPLLIATTFVTLPVTADVGLEYIPPSRRQGGVVHWLRFPPLLSFPRGSVPKRGSTSYAKEFISIPLSVRAAAGGHADRNADNDGKM
jgi:hypothetical protein